MTDIQNIVISAGVQFSGALATGMEDVRIGRLHYHLLRLTLAGLTHEDVAGLDELGRLALQGSDITAQATKVRERQDSSPLARAIAEIVSVDRPDHAELKHRLLGAVLGAYIGVHDDNADVRALLAIQGAASGAAAAVLIAAINRGRADQAWEHYTDTE